MSTLEAGRELDGAVAEKVMRLPVCDSPRDTELPVKCSLFGVVPHFAPDDRELPHYSTDIDAAWHVLDEMVWRVGTANIRLDMEDYGRGAGTQEEGAERAVWVTIGDHTAFGPVAWAICQAALAAVSRPAAAPADASPET